MSNLKPDVTVVHEDGIFKEKKWLCEALDAWQPNASEIPFLDSLACGVDFPGWSELALTTSHAQFKARWPFMNLQQRLKALDFNEDVRGFVYVEMSACTHEMHEFFPFATELLSDSFLSDTLRFSARIPSKIFAAKRRYPKCTNSFRSQPSF